MKDEFAIVLDYLPHGKGGTGRGQPVAQVLGDKFFNLLEVVPQDNVAIKPQEKVYIGQGKRDQIKTILGKITADKLTATAFSELEPTIKRIITESPQRFIEFFNQSGPLTTRLHQLELLHGIGKKHMWQILDERKKGKFADLADIQKRVSLLPNPENTLVKRIISELEGKEKWYLFVAPPKDESQEYGQRRERNF